MRRPCLPMLFFLVACLALSLAPGASGAARADSSASCAEGRIAVSTGCVSPATARKQITALVRREMGSLGVKATILRVDTGSQPLIAKGYGHSMAGVRATPEMRFRIGSIAIPHLVTLLLLLDESGELALDDKLAKYLPGFPDADRISLRMLANSTSGYRDWVQGNPDFVAQLLAAPFRQWRVSELLATAFALGPACAPGSCFHYAHTNFAVLAAAIAKATGRPVGGLIRERVLKPLGLRATAISRLPAMSGPVLHSYTAERGVYEDSTFWSPSWTIGAGTVMSATIGDVTHTARAFGSGELLSPAVARQRTKPPATFFPPFSEDLYYGLGLLVSNGWRIQNPMLNGYTGIAAYLPKRKLSVGIVATALPRAAGSGQAFATLLFRSLAAYLAPGSQPRFPG